MLVIKMSYITVSVDYEHNLWIIKEHLYNQRMLHTYSGAIDNVQKQPIHFNCAINVQHKNNSKTSFQCHNTLNVKQFGIYSNHYNY